MRRAGLLVVACLGASLGACLGACLGGSAPKYDYFVLTSTHALGQAPAAPAIPAADQPTVGISDVTIPGYLDRESIVTRTDDHQVSYSKTDRWAEPLDQAFERTLQQELAATMAPVGIAVSPRTASPTYDVHVDVLRFERRGPDRVELWARWTLRSETAVVYTGETRVDVAVSGAGDAAAAAALSGTIARLASDIGEQLKTQETQVAARGRRRPSR